MTKIYELSWSQMQAELQAGHLSSREIILGLFERADAVNDSLNALIHRFDERALAAADSADDARTKNIDYGPLHGLPLTLKEAVGTRGTEVNLGVPSHKGEVPDSDAVVVQVLRRNGAIVLGKTNIPQTLIFHETVNPVYGRTNNPWNLERTPGGSSGGEAAAIASGISPMGIGTDIGGSIRIPAAFSGICGLKLTERRWSDKGLYGPIGGQESIRGVCGPMARNVRDLSLVMRGADSPAHHGLDPYVAPVSTADPEAMDLSKLRVGYFVSDGFFEPAASVQRAVTEAADALRARGATLIAFEPRLSVEITLAYFGIMSADGAARLHKYMRGDRPVAQVAALRTIAKLPPIIREIAATFMASQGEVRVEKLLRAVHKKSVEELWTLCESRGQYQQDVLQAWDEMQLDAVICPPHVTPALRHGQSTEFALGGCYSMRYNALNFPAGVVPVTRVRADETERLYKNDRLDATAAKAEADSCGLPLGVQVVGRPYREDICLAVMMGIEDEVRGRDGFPRTPIQP